MGTGLSIAFIVVLCGMTVGCVALAFKVAMPERARLGGLCITGVTLGYLVLTWLLGSVWGVLMNEWYGRWPAFTLGIVFGVPALVVTAATGLGMLGVAGFMVVSGRPPG